MKLLIILVIVLAIIAIVQLTKVYDLTRSLRKTREEEISPADNKLSANLLLVWMFVFFAGTIWLYVRHQDYLPEPASAHGVDVDWLMNINIWMITIMFFIMNAALFIVAWKFYYRKDRKARFFSHDNRLEMLWTGIPGVAMAFIIVFGLITWKKMTGPASSDALQIEVFSKQFDWTVRYPGQDGEFGAANFNLIGGDNPMGLITTDRVNQKLTEIEEEIEKIHAEIEENKKTPILPETYVEALEDKIYRLQRHKQRILDLNETKTDSGVSSWETGFDDNIVKGELHLMVGKEVEFIFRSQDVIHSAYMPHFRAQMNTVPGVPTRFKMTPTITTNEMRKKLKDDKFDYILLCNKICGAAHNNMQIKVIVEDSTSYVNWLKEQKTFIPKAEPQKKDTTQTAAPTEPIAQANH